MDQSGDLSMCIAGSYVLPCTAYSQAVILLPFPLPFLPSPSLSFLHPSSFCLPPSLPPYSHYHVVVVILLPGQTSDDLMGDPDTAYDSLDDLDVHRESFCEQEFSTAKAYITAEFGQDLFPAGGLFIVGGVGINAPNDNPDNYTNGHLCFSGRYTFFVRAYIYSQSVRNILPWAHDSASIIYSPSIGFWYDHQTSSKSR